MGALLLWALWLRIRFSVVRSKVMSRLGPSAGRAMGRAVCATRFVVPFTTCCYQRIVMLKSAHTLFLSCIQLNHGLKEVLVRINYVDMLVVNVYVVAATVWTKFDTVIWPTCE
jgi:hypothetical protein